MSATETIVSGKPPCPPLVNFYLAINRFRVECSKKQRIINKMSRKFRDPNGRSCLLQNVDNSLPSGGIGRRLGHFFRLWNETSGDFFELETADV